MLVVTISRFPIVGLLRSMCALMVVLIAATACQSPKRLSSVPLLHRPTAQLAGIPDARFFPTITTDTFLRIAREATKRQRVHYRRPGNSTLPTANFLAISGGGEDGAFAVGVLVGWTKAGTRPQFQAVTGVSTGALIAPFAFLGPEYDETIKSLYINARPSDIFESRGIIMAFFEDAFADTQPLRRLVRRYITKEVLAAVAREYEKGRLLFVGTTDLDARIPVVWNMGAIAAKGTPQAHKLFQEVLIASAAVPGAFPPVLIDVSADGKRYQEMHVDGGAISQLFLYPTQLRLNVEGLRYSGSHRKRRTFVIRNARLDPKWATVERRTLNIMSAAVSALIAAQGKDAIQKVYLAAKRDGVDFNLAYIPETFNRKSRRAFDTAYMKALFQVGYDLAAKGYPWRKSPPGYSGR